MAIDPRQLAELGKAREGSLAEVPLPVLLQALYAADRTGVLELKVRHLEKRIALEEGVPVDCESNLLHETTARFLVERGKLGEGDYQKVLREAALAEERPEQTLLRLQLLAPFDLFRLLQQNLAFKILDLFCPTWAEAKFRILPEPPRVEQPLRVNLARLVFTGVESFLPFRVVEEGLIALSGKRLALQPEPPHKLSALKLDGKQTRIFGELKRGTSLDALCSEAKGEMEGVLRLLYALHVLGFVDLEERVARAEPSRPAAPPAPEPAPSGPPASSGASRAEIAALENAVSSAYLGLRGKDPFDLFGLREEAASAQIRDAFLAWSERFAPWRFSGPELSPLADKARDLFVFGARAFAQLADPEGRALVLKRRAAAREAATRERRPDFAIRTDLLDAKTQHEEGLRRLAQGQTAAALRYLEFACDCDPRNGLFRAHLAQARFAENPQGMARQALAELGEALRVDPGCAEAWFVTGEIYRFGNDLARAEEAYRRASKAAPGDRRPVERLRELVQLQGKRAP